MNKGLERLKVSVSFVKLFQTVLIGVLLMCPIFIFAQDGRSYFYESISQKFTVNKDTTVDVEETQVYNFQGEYHKGWRSIPLKGVSNITNVVVLDGETFYPLQYTPVSLEKTNPESWGKYTYRRNNGNLEIEWYYDAKDTSKTWILKYKLTGALSFLKEKDELYWNLFTDYDAPVSSANATIIIPPNTYSPSDHQVKIYITNAENPVSEVSNNRTFYFSAENISPKGIVTIAGGWPRGIVDRNQFWITFFKSHYVLLGSVLVILLTIIFLATYWYFTERYRKGRGTIIPQYEPPVMTSGARIPPAMAEVLVREGVYPKSWSATVVDLAVRGYLKIEEDGSKNLDIKKIISLVLPISLLTIFFGVSVFTGNSTLKIFFLAFIFLIIFFGLIKKNYNKDYIIESIKEYDIDPNLYDYEKRFLSAILQSGKFSTKSYRYSQSKGRVLYAAMKNVEKDLLKEVEEKTGAYAKPISKNIYLGVGFILTILISFFAFMITAGIFGGNFPILLIIVLADCIIISLLFIKFEARLSREGAILREDWLGFKMYLEKAEKYRMQAMVTPDLFEKYLPYAIIFGVEKKWGKAFEGISMQPPSWYHSNTIAGSHVGSAGNLSSGFSAGAFSASFASSFTSAFSSSGGGGGGSGGGGSSGGGGGGGGGGAS